MDVLLRIYDASFFHNSVISVPPPMSTRPGYCPVVTRSRKRKFAWGRGENYVTSRDELMTGGGDGERFKAKEGANHAFYHVPSIKRCQTNFYLINTNVNERVTGARKRYEYCNPVMNDTYLQDLATIRGS